MSPAVFDIHSAPGVFIVVFVPTVVGVIAGAAIPGVLAGVSAVFSIHTYLLFLELPLMQAFLLLLAPCCF